MNFQTYFDNLLKSSKLTDFNDDASSVALKDIKNIQKRNETIYIPLGIGMQERDRICYKSTPIITIDDIIHVDKITCVKYDELTTSYVEQEELPCFIEIANIPCINNDKYVPLLFLKTTDSLKVFTKYPDITNMMFKVEYTGYILTVEMRRNMFRQVLNYEFDHGKSTISRGSFLPIQLNKSKK